jgi:predicted TIM-barrel fold metal-dependent hydrolase
MPTPPSLSPAVAAAYEAVTGPASTIAVMVHLLISRILLRHPKLRVVFAESSIGWGGYQVEFADQQFREDGLINEGYELFPSQLFQRQCYLTGWYDDAALATRHIIGVENIMWATNFPQANSTWPRSQDHIRKAFAGIPADERDAMLWGNAAKLYRL